MFLTETLPDELDYYVLEFLDANSLIALCSTSYQLNSICRDNKLWKLLFAKRFSSGPNPKVTDWFSHYSKQFRTINIWNDKCKIFMMDIVGSDRLPDIIERACAMYAKLSKKVPQFVQICNTKRGISTPIEYIFTDKQYDAKICEFTTRIGTEQVEFWDGEFEMRIL